MYFLNLFEVIGSVANVANGFVHDDHVAVLAVLAVLDRDVDFFDGLQWN